MQGVDRLFPFRQPRVLRDGAADIIHIAVDGHVHGLDAAAHDDLMMKLLRLIFAGEALELSNQLKGFFLRDEFGGLHAVHQQLQFGKLKVPLPDKVNGRSAVLSGLDVQPELPQRLSGIRPGITQKAQAPGERGSRTLALFCDILTGFCCMGSGVLR